MIDQVNRIVNVEHVASRHADDDLHGHGTMVEKGRRNARYRVQTSFKIKSIGVQTVRSRAYIEELEGFSRFQLREVKLKTLTTTAASGILEQRIRASAY